MSDLPSPALSFGGVVDAYERGRPGYPREAAVWLVGEQPATVLELGAGTGKLTETLVGLGHDVHATDPDDTMLARLRARLPDVLTSASGAEEIPAPDGVFDVVVAAQCFHWFDHDRALAEIQRVLKPGGRLAVVWNQRDERIPWVRRLGRIMGTQDQQRSAGPLEASPLFEDVEAASFGHWQLIDRDSVQDLVLSRSNNAVLPEADREAKRAEVLAFYDDYGRGMDGMQLPYVASCFRATAAERLVVAAEPTAQPAADDEPATSGETPPTGHGEGDDVLLIDFR